MINDLISLLPKPPPGKIGWPWTKASKLLPECMLDKSPWPKISVVTPSCNQVQFIEETIRSVLLQNYPNLEYIIIDGGSTDGSVEIIKRYEPWLAYWVSEPDRGQSHAINKGFQKSTGEILAWINSDDFYAPGAFYKVADAFNSTKTLWVAGLCHRIDQIGEIIATGNPPHNVLEKWYVGLPYSQPSIFWDQRLWEEVGEIDDSLNYSFDYDLFLRFIKHQPFAYWINTHLANFRYHSSSKSIKDQLKFIPERELIYKRHTLRGFNIVQRSYIHKKRRDRKARIYMENAGNFSLISFLIKIIWIAPWKIFRKEYINCLTQKLNEILLRKR